MSSVTLSVRQLLRLARKDQLSLELRRLWQVSEGRDPYNLLRMVVMQRYLLCLFCVSSAVAIAAVAATKYQWLPENHWSVPIISTLWVMWMLAWAFHGAGTETALYSAKLFQEKFSRLLEHFGPVTEITPSTKSFLKVADLIAEKSFRELKDLAKEVVIRVAVRVLNHADKPKAEVDSKWHSTKSQLDSEFTETYKFFESWGLVNGGYDYFFEEAKKRRAERAAVAAAVGAEQTAA